MKRFVTFFLALVFSFTFFAFPFSARAVVNPSFIYSAMYSFLLSTGYQFSFSGDSSDVVGAMQDLYGEYVSDASGPSADSYYDYISLSQFGQFVFGYPIIQELQNFASWIKTKFSLSDNGSEFVTVTGGSSGSYYSSDAADFYVFTNNLATQPLYADSTAKRTYTTRYYVYTDEFTKVTGDDPVPMTFVETTSDAVFMAVSTSPFTLLQVSSTLTLSDNSTTSSSTTLSSQLQTYNNRTFYTYYSSFSRLSDQTFVPSNSYASSFSNISQSQRRNQIAYVFAFPDANSSFASLAMKIGSSVIDRANEVDENQSLVVDIGLSAGASEEDAVTAVGSGIALGSLSDAVPATSVVADAVIDTPVQPYPDVDGLGLPELGLALTTRFPFSIPWDISAIYSALSAPSEPPVKTFDLIPASVMARWGVNANTSITIDLTEQKYSVLLAIIHWSCIIGFCLGLAVMTKRYVWTTGG